MSSSRIAKNTIVLYVRLIITMIINLYMVRVVIKALGAEDYGIFNVVAGVVTMLSCLTSILSSSIQRFYSFSLGENNREKLNKIFVSSIDLAFIFSLVVLVLSETFGLWFVNKLLVIPPEKIIEANWVYQFSILLFIISIIQIPFMSAIIAHEQMNLFAIITTLECLLKLIAALPLNLFAENRLALYGIGLFLAQFVCFLIYFIYSYKHYPECKYNKYNRDISVKKDLLSFSGWVFLGSVAGIGMNQVNTILVNIFFGPITNAARAIAIQVSNAINSFAGNFILALRPPMIKLYANKEYGGLNLMFDLCNKFVFFCMLFISMPLIFEMPYILDLWLGVSDSDSILFCRLMVVYVFIMALNNPISIIMHATGKVKQYHLYVEIFTILCVPATFILFYLGYPAYTTFIIMIIAAILSHIVRLVCLHINYKDYRINDYFTKFIIPSSLISFIIITVIYFIHHIQFNILLKLMVELITTLVLILVLVYIIGLTKLEREFVTHFVKSVMNKMLKEQ